jgi:hypothetical protein
VSGSTRKLYEALLAVWEAFMWLWEAVYGFLP